MLMPKRVKYRKQMRGRMKGKAYSWRGSSVGRIWPPGFGAGLGYGAAD